MILGRHTQAPKNTGKAYTKKDGTGPLVAPKKQTSLKESNIIRSLLTLRT